MKTQKLPRPIDLRASDKVGAKVIFLAHHKKAGSIGVIEKTLGPFVFVKLEEETIKAHFMDLEEVLE